MGQRLKSVPLAPRLSSQEARETRANARLLTRFLLTQEWWTCCRLFCASVRISIWMIQSYSWICGWIDGHHLDLRFQRRLSSALQVTFNRLRVGVQRNGQANENYEHKVCSKWWLRSSGHGELAPVSSGLVCLSLYSSSVNWKMNLKVKNGF